MKYQRWVSLFKEVFDLVRNWVRDFSSSVV